MARKEEYKEGVLVKQSPNLIKVFGPICINGDEYNIFKDLDMGWWDFRYGVYRLSGSSLDPHKIVTASLTLWGAKVYLWKLRNFR